MLNRILLSIAIVSLLGALVVVGLWVAGDHGYRGEWRVNWQGVTYSVTPAAGGRLMIGRQQKLGGPIVSDVRFEAAKTVVGYFLVIPALWSAIAIRRRLPRAPRFDGKGLPRDRTVRQKPGR